MGNPQGTPTKSDKEKIGAARVILKLIADSFPVASSCSTAKLARAGLEALDAN